MDERKLVLYNREYMRLLVMVKKLQKGFHQTNLHGGQLPNLKILR